MEMKPAEEWQGIAVSIPVGYESKREDGALRVFLPAKERSRSPVSIVLTVGALAAMPKEVKTKKSEGRDISYSVQEEEGGSGGPALRLHAWTEVRARVVSLTSLAQPDSGGDGDFRAEWAILHGLR